MTFQVVMADDFYVRNNISFDIKMNNQYINFSTRENKMFLAAVAL